jgi:outer membrane protein OmpA-like peptidoglycan-associated protein
MMRRVLALAGVAALAAGCATPSTTQVTLLPQPDGRPSAVEVTAKQDSRATELSQPYDSAKLSGRAVEVEHLDASAVQKAHGRLLSVQPPVPERFTLYFKTGSSELTPESKTALTEILARATERPGGEILVIGHTDTVGKTETNDALSLSRARAVRDMILVRGFSPSRVYASGRGEREPLIPTADETNEPKNRRVEIQVR